MAVYTGVTAKTLYTFLACPKQCAHPAHCKPSKLCYCNTVLDDTCTVQTLSLYNIIRNVTVTKYLFLKSIYFPEQAYFVFEIRAMYAVISFYCHRILVEGFLLFVSLYLYFWKITRLLPR